MKAWKNIAAILLSTMLAGFPVFPDVEAAEDPGISERSPKEAAAMIRDYGSGKNFVLLDVRTPAEHGTERIDGAVLIDYFSPSFRDELEKLDRGKTYLVYCRTGNRSGKAVKVMKELGFHDIHHLSGGIVKWKEDGLPTER